MWTNTFLFMWTIGIMQERLSSVPTECAKRVQQCPVEKEKWEEKNDQLQCAANYGYVCLRDSNGYLLETCMANFPVQAHSSNCPILYACKKNEAYLGPDDKYYHCPAELSGCPPKNHPEYSIHQLYKYPKCIQSNLSAENGNTSPGSTTFIYEATISTDDIIVKGNNHVVIGILVTALLLTVLVCFIGGLFVYSRKTNHEYAQVTDGDNKEDYPELRSWIQSINESEADRIRILPLKEDDTIEVDRIYVPLSVDDDYKIHTRMTADRQISKITPDKMFYIAPGTPARFVFMLGDAGYGKTVQCKRIAKSWCKAWKAENTQGNDIQVINLENTKQITLNDWEKSLKDFQFLFYVQMRDVNNEHVSMKDVIYDYYRRFDILQEYLDAILDVLKGKRYKCLIILDGLDEWNLSEYKKKDLLHKGIPNCEGMLNCTFLITMRPWRFMEVDSICRQGLFDKVLRLHGLDNNGIEKLTTNMLCNYFNIDIHSKEFLEQRDNIRKKASSLSPRMSSLMKIPILAVFFILTWHENIEMGHSLTTFYLSIIEALIKRSCKREQTRPDNSESPFPSILNNFYYVTKHLPDISRLGKLAFDNLSSRNTTFVLSDVQLKKSEVRETVDFFLRIGLLSKHDASGGFHEDNVRFTFLHKTIQEFIYSLYLVYDRSETDIVKFIIEKVSDIEKALDLSIVLTFLSGLSPAVGCKVSRHITELSSIDEDFSRYRDYFSSEAFNKVFHLFELQLSCYREVRGGESVKHFRKNEMKFSLSDIFLHGNDTDRLTIRESAEVLRYHAKDIISLYMKFIPDDNMEGITNVELKTFLHESESLVALTINGYDRGNCRLFDFFNNIRPCLHTLGLHNVAFTDNILTDFLTKDVSKRSIKSLGLFYIKSPDDLVVDHQYLFPSVYRFSSTVSGYVQKRKMCQVSENSTPLRKKNRQPLLREVLKVLPHYRDLSTLHVSYMDSDEDRRMLLSVLPQIKTLNQFGYHGSSIYETTDEEYDTEVIKVLLTIERLQIILLSQIVLKEDILSFSTMSQLRRIRLQQFEMKQSYWMIFVKSLSNIVSLSKVVLYDTNIGDETVEILKKSSVTIAMDDSKEWRECEKKNQFCEIHLPQKIFTN